MAVVGLSWDPLNFILRRPSPLHLFRSATKCYMATTASQPGVLLLSDWKARISPSAFMLWKPLAYKHDPPRFGYKFHWTFAKRNTEFGSSTVPFLCLSMYKKTRTLKRQFSRSSSGKEGIAAVTPRSKVSFYWININTRRIHLFLRGLPPPWPKATDPLWAVISQQ